MVRKDHYDQIDTADLENSVVHIHFISCVFLCILVDFCVILCMI